MHDITIYYGDGEVMKFVFQGTQIAALNYILRHRSHKPIERLCFE